MKSISKSGAPKSPKNHRPEGQFCSGTARQPARARYLQCEATLEWRVSPDAGRSRILSYDAVTLQDLGAEDADVAR